MSGTNENRFYVYVYLDPRKPGKYTYDEYTFDHEPFYVGKGSGQRYRGHLWEANSVIKNEIIREDKPNLNWLKIYKIIKIYNETGDWPIIKKVNNFLSESKANNTECLLINIIGRKDLNTGPLLNMTDGGDGGNNPSPITRTKMKNNRIGKKHSQKTKDKMSKSHNGISPKQKLKEKYKDDFENIFKEVQDKKSEAQKKVLLQYSIEGKFIKEHKGIEETAKLFGLDCTNLSANARGISKTAAGFIWKYKTEENFPLIIEAPVFKKKATPVIQYSLNGEFIKQWNCIRDICKEFNIHHSAIISVCKGKTKTSKGYIWKYT